MIGKHSLVRRMRLDLVVAAAILVSFAVGDGCIFEHDDDSGYFSEVDGDGDSDADHLRCLDEEVAVQYSYQDDVVDISAHGGYIYLIGGDPLHEVANEAAVIDATSSGSMSLIGGVDEEFRSAEDAAYKDGYLFIAGDDGGYVLDPQLVVLDVSDHGSDPDVVSRLELPMLASEIVVSGSYAYIGATSSSEECYIFVVNVSNPTSPTEVTQKQVGGGTINGIFLDGDTLYIAVTDDDFAESGRVRFLDVSNPSAPVLADYSISFDAPAQSVFAVGSKLFVGGGSESFSNDTPNFFAIYSVGDSDSDISRLGWRTMDDIPVSIAVDGDVAYIANGNRLEAYNVSDPSDIGQMGCAYYEAKQVVFDPEDDDVLYMASDWNNWIQRFDRCAQPWPGLN